MRTDLTHATRVPFVIFEFLSVEPEKSGSINLEKGVEENLYARWFSLEKTQRFLSLHFILTFHCIMNMATATKSIGRFDILSDAFLSY